MLTAELLDTDGRLLGTTSVPKPTVTAHILPDVAGLAARIVLKDGDTVVGETPVASAKVKEGDVVSGSITLLLKP